MFFFCDRQEIAIGRAQAMEQLQEYLFISRCNEFACDTSGRDHSLPEPQQGGPCLASRALAIAQIAMADAYNSIVNAFARYTDVEDFPGGNPLAAVAQANHDVLRTLFSQQAAQIDATLNMWLDSLSDDGSAKAIGIAAGKRAAELILALRADDGSANLNGIAPPTNTTSNPGQWSQAPPESNAGGDLAYGEFYGTNCKPYVVDDTAEVIALFRAPPPPSLDSQEYLIAYNNQQSIGGKGDSTSPSVRTEDQYQYAIFWGYDGARELCAPPTLYAAIVRQVMAQHRKSGVELLRALALAHVAMAEAAVASWESKYFYNHWRPITAIRYTGPGNHPKAIPQTDWLCLGAPATNGTNDGVNFTPPFPAYVSGHAAFGGALFGVLRLLFGTDDVPFQFCSRELDGHSEEGGVVRPFRPRTYLRLSQAEMENGDSRLPLGIHWYYDRDEGIAMGNKVANVTVERKFQL